MARTIWEPIYITMDDETGFISEYCTPYRDGYYYLSSYYSFDDGEVYWALFYSRLYECEYEEYLLKKGFKCLKSAKSYYTTNQLLN